MLLKCLRILSVGKEFFDNICDSVGGQVGEGFGQQLAQVFSHEIRVRLMADLL